MLFFQQILYEQFDTGVNLVSYLVQCIEAGEANLAARLCNTAQCPFQFHHSLLGIIPHKYGADWTKLHLSLVPKQRVADFVGAEVLQAAEAVLDILNKTFGVLGVELLQSAAE